MKTTAKLSAVFFSFIYDWLFAHDDLLSVTLERNVGFGADTCVNISFSGISIRD